MNNRRIAISLLLLLFVSALGFSSSTHSLSISSSQSTRTMITSQVDSPIEIGSNVELAELSTAGVGTRSDPYIIEGKVITGRNCVYIHDTTSSFILRNSEFIFNSSGVSGIGTSVIRLENTEDGVIENCYVRGGGIAIELRVASNCSIINCIVFDAYRGILLDTATNCTIIDSSIFDNSIGIMAVNSESCTIINNTIYANYQRGVHVEVFCEDNTIFGNAIGWNSVQNARDHGENTVFTDGVSIGNGWSDYNSSEEYSIPGTGGSIDPYATFLFDSIPPTVFGLFDIVVDVDNNDETLTWSASDNFPKHYQIYVDDLLEEDNVWDGLDISFSLEHLTLGTYTITLNLTDGSGNMRSDEVVVSVISFLLGGIGTELVMYASGVTMACFVVIIILVKRFA